MEKEKQTQPKKVNVKPNEKRSVAKTQSQAIPHLSSGVNKLADGNAKRLKMEEKDRESLLSFRKEEATNNRKLEKEIPEIL